MDILDFNILLSINNNLLKKATCSSKFSEHNFHFGKFSFSVNLPENFPVTPPPHPDKHWWDEKQMNCNQIYTMAQQGILLRN